jgi:chromosome segregation ATPase
VARTLAQLSAESDLLGQKLAATEQGLRDLWAAVEGLTEQVQTAREDAAVHREQLAQVRRELDDERARGRDRDQALAELRQENALLRQRLDDHLKRVDTWSARAWSLIVLLIGTVFSLASGLIVTLAKK